MGSRRPAVEATSSMDMLQEILLKLPTKDVARCCCVSKLWRRVGSNPSFRSLHSMAGHVVSAAQISKTLLVSERCQAGRSDEAIIFDASSGNTMCCVPIPGGYSLANICNGLLCFVHRYSRDDPGPEAPVVVCNPVTGETLALPRAPPLMVTPKGTYRHQLALGFGPPTKEYKLFRLSTHSLSSEQRVEVDVYTLGDADGWRHHSFLSPCRPTKISPLVSMDGKLYVVTNGWKHGYGWNEIPRRILVIDVATELCRTYPLPDYECFHFESPPMGAFELSGRLCFAAHALICRRPETNVIHFWVMSPSEGDEDEQPDWELHYSFPIVEGRPCFVFHRPWACWLDHDEILYYAWAGVLHRYSMRQGSSVDV